MSGGLWPASLTGRGLQRAEDWWAGAWRASLVGGGFAWLSRVSVALAAGSLFLSTARVGPRPLSAGDPALSGTARLAAAVYLFLRRMLGLGVVGRLSRRLGRGVGLSVLTRGGWLVAGGASVLGLSLGGLVTESGDRAPLVVLLPVGVLLSLLGIVLGRAKATGLVAGLFASREREVNAASFPVRPLYGRRPLPALILLAFIIGLFAGMVPGDAVRIAALALLPILAVCVGYRPEFLLLLVACFPWVDWVARSMVGGSVGAAWDELLVLGSVAALGISVLVTLRWDLTTVPQALPVLAAVAAGIGSVVVNQVGPEVGLFALRVTFQPLLFFFLGYWLPRDMRMIRWVVALFLASSLLLSLHGLYQYATHAPMPASWVDVRETGIGTRAYSIIENPNGLGAFLLMGTLLSLSMALGEGSRYRRLGAAAAAVVLAAGVAVTFSRGAWIGLGVGVLTLAALSHRRLLAGLVAAIAATLLFAPRPFVDRLTFAFSGAYIAKSLSAGRLYIWRAAAYRLAEHPWFGVGLGTFGGTSSFLFGFSRLWIDNYYIQLATEGGILLLAAFLWLLLRCAKGLVAAHGRVHQPFFRAVVAGIFAGMVAVSVANVTASVWEALAVGTCFWFLVGLGASLDDAHARPLPPVRDMSVRDGAVQQTRAVTHS